MSKCARVCVCLCGLCKHWHQAPHTHSSADMRSGLMYSKPSNSDWSIFLTTSLQRNQEKSGYIFAAGGICWQWRLLVALELTHRLGWVEWAHWWTGRQSYPARILLRCWAWREVPPASAPAKKTKRVGRVKYLIFTHNINKLCNHLVAWTLQDCSSTLLLKVLCSGHFTAGPSFFYHYLFMLASCFRNCVLNTIFSKKHKTQILRQVAVNSVKYAAFWRVQQKSKLWNASMEYFLNFKLFFWTCYNSKWN